MSQPLTEHDHPLITFLPGNGTEYRLPVRHVASDFARGPDGTCAFCEGDPCAEGDAAPQRIKDYMAGMFAGAPAPWFQPQHCPFCLGRPT